MVAYNFQARFVPRILARTKQQTMRAVGLKRHARPGETIQIQHGPRFAPVRAGVAMCEHVEEIALVLGSRPLVESDALGRIDDLEDLDRFAVRDGFDRWKDLEAFWVSTHKAFDLFEGLRISWGDTFKAEAGQ